MIEIIEFKPKELCKTAQQIELIQDCVLPILREDATCNKYVIENFSRDFMLAKAALLFTADAMEKIISSKQD